MIRGQAQMGQLAQNVHGGWSASLFQFQDMLNMSGTVTIVYQEASSSCKTNWMIAMVLNHIGGLAGGGWHQTGGVTGSRSDAQNSELPVLTCIL
ncbi:hypothetical protein DERF_002666, partial [Dermatophagoides farinae]